MFDPIPHDPRSMPCSGVAWLPYGWIDAPPSLNRLIGVQWLARLLFPGQFPGDMREVARDFYRQFYQVDLSAPELDKLLEGAEQRR